MSECIKEHIKWTHQAITGGYSYCPLLVEHLYYIFISGVILLITGRHKDSNIRGKCTNFGTFPKMVLARPIAWWKVLSVLVQTQGCDERHYWRTKVKNYFLFFVRCYPGHVEEDIFPQWLSHKTSNVEGWTSSESFIQFHWFVYFIDLLYWNWHNFETVRDKIRIHTKIQCIWVSYSFCFLDI